MSVAWVVAAQGICGIAKDLTKTASKSAIKVAEKEARAEDAEGRLFRWVAWFTGSKNAMKGLGFFLGGLLLQSLGFRYSLWLMAGLLLLVLAGVFFSMPRTMGKAKASTSARELFGKSTGVNLLAAARIALFGARDVWFVVGVPVFLYANGWTFTTVGGFMALWTIFYGLIQASAPAVVKRSADGLFPPKCRLRGCGRPCWLPCLRLSSPHLPSTSHSARISFLLLAYVFWCGFRCQLVCPLLSHPRLCGIGKGGRGRRFLLCRKCRRTIRRNAALRPALPMGWTHGVSRRICVNACGLLPHHAVPATCKRRRRPRLNIGRRMNNISNNTRLEYRVSAERIDSHGSNAQAKEAAITLDTEVGRPH